MQGPHLCFWDALRQGPEGGGPGEDPGYLAWMLREETGFALETQALVAGALEQLELLIKMGAIAHTA